MNRLSTYPEDFHTNTTLICRSVLLRLIVIEKIKMDSEKKSFAIIASTKNVNDIVHAI